MPTVSEALRRRIHVADPRGHKCGQGRSLAKITELCRRKGKGKEGSKYSSEVDLRGGFERARARAGGQYQRGNLVGKPRRQRPRGRGGGFQQVLAKHMSARRTLEAEIAKLQRNWGRNRMKLLERERADSLMT